MVERKNKRILSLADAAKIIEKSKPLTEEQKLKARFRRLGSNYNEYDDNNYSYAKQLIMKRDI